MPNGPHSRIPRARPMNSRESTSCSTSRETGREASFRGAGKVRHATAAATGISDGAVLMQLARRMLLRSSLLCGVLLVVTADLDIQAPQLQTVLQTYFPFVLALPCVSLSSFLGEALRAANRTLGMVVAAYAVNLSLLLAVAVAPPDASLVFYSWAFFLGSLASAALAFALARHALPATRAEHLQPISREALQTVDSREFIGLARGILQWGPLCVLSIFAPPVQMAQYAVAARTALIIDFFLPALNLTGCSADSSEPHSSTARSWCCHCCCWRPRH